MRNRRFSKAAILSIALTVGPAILATIPSASIAYAQETQTDTGIMLELFDQQPGDSSAPLSIADLSGGGDLGDLMAEDNAAQGRYLRVTVTQGDTVDTRVYRVLITPSNGRVFIVSPQGVISLDNLLRQGGLVVAKDNKAVTMGTGSIELNVDGLADSASVPPMDTSTSTSTTATGTAAAPADTTTTAAPADTSASSTPAAPADTTTAAAPTDTSTTTAPADTSAASTTAAPADASATGSPLTAAVNQDLGKLTLSVLPTSATAPASRETNFYVLPYTDATDPTQGIKDNLVTLDYASAASLTDVAAYYDKLMADQGFTKVADDAQNKTSDAQAVQVYKRGNATVMLTIDRDAQGKYKVSVDLSNLVQSLGQ